MTRINPNDIEQLTTDCIRFEDSFIKFMAHNNFQRKRIERKGLSRNQLLAYRDFQDNFQQRITNAEMQFQAPINKALTKRELTNLYSAHITTKFTAKQFSEKTGMNQNTSRREINSAIQRGLIEKLPRKHAKEVQEYRYK